MNAIITLNVLINVTKKLFGIEIKINIPQPTSPETPACSPSDPVIVKR